MLRETITWWNTTWTAGRHTIILGLIYVSRNHAQSVTRLTTEKILKAIILCTKKLHLAWWCSSADYPAPCRLTISATMAGYYCQLVQRSKSYLTCITMPSLTSETDTVLLKICKINILYIRTSIQKKRKVWITYKAENDNEPEGHFLQQPSSFEMFCTAQERAGQRQLNHQGYIPAWIFKQGPRMKLFQRRTPGNENEVYILAQTMTLLCKFSIGFLQ